MKFLNFILAIYLVSLSCMPCADLEINSFAHTNSEYTSSHKNHNHDKENDLCPPFCMCNCCGAQVLSYFPEISFNFPQVTNSIKTSIPSYKSVFASNFYGSIWQPPQIA